MMNQEQELALFKKLYFTLFGKADDALLQLDKALGADGGLELIGIFRAKGILLEAVKEAEEAYLEEDTRPTERGSAEERFARFTKTLKSLDDEERLEFLHFMRYNGGAPSNEKA